MCLDAKYLQCKTKTQTRQQTDNNKSLRISEGGGGGEVTGWRGVGLQATEAQKCPGIASPPVSADGVLRFWKTSGAPHRGGECWKLCSSEIPGSPPPTLPPSILAVLLLPLGRAWLGRKASGPRHSRRTHMKQRKSRVLSILTSWQFRASSL